MDDSALNHLFGLAHLQTLDLRDTEVTKIGVKTLKKALPRCAVKN